MPTDFRATLSAAFRALLRDAPNAIDAIPEYVVASNTLALTQNQATTSAIEVDGSLTPQDVRQYPELMYFKQGVMALTRSPPEDRDTSCGICLEPLLKGENLLKHIGTCGNAYHKICLLTWMEKAPTCPKCKAEIMPTVQNMLHILNTAGGFRSAGTWISS